MRLRWRRWAAGFVKRPSKVVNPGSALGDSLQHVEEFRIRNTRAVGAVNNACPFSPQRGNAEGHGNAVVSGGINFGAVKLLFSSYGQSIRPLFDARSHGTQVSCDRDDSV